MICGASGTTGRPSTNSACLRTWRSRVANEAGRDKNRTPFQWAHAPNGGFSPPGVETWLPVNPNWADGVNVEDQAADPGSLLSFYRQLLRVRSTTPALVTGSYIPLYEDAEEYLAFLRQAPARVPTGSDRRCLVVLNFSDVPLMLDIARHGPFARVLFCTRGNAGRVDDLSELTLEPFGVYIGALL